MAHTTHDFDWATMADRLEREADLFLPVFADTAEWARSVVPDIRRVYDVGSGPGGAALAFARAFPSAEVVAVDGAAPLLDRARERAAREGRAVRTHLGDLPDCLADLEPADLIWISRAVHHVGDQQAVLDALARLLRPGGVLAVVEGGLPTRFLPRDIGIGRPGLQARVDVATEAWFTEMRAALPDTVTTVEDWPALLARAGLVSGAVRGVLINRPAPLDLPTRQILRDTLRQTLDHAGDLLDAEDRATLAALTDPDSPAGILRRPDAFYLSAVTVYTGQAS
ncbi:class I SAM-dependent methyltransferase [Actinokineospora iranica]|uniref:Methyltransferase domain-containing protein n=1 Tax=Actinokineospora iranica TaxID=1271860 RepID=A0A1G6RW69_9PSEU|nr:class I SAM-dependent methyltransferase [Actinokineospora iranica]SDD08920.1 Methyltransferase domain-containing protein [Actinokineospora iranica]